MINPKTIMKNFDQCLIYGAGLTGKVLYRILLEHGFKPAAFLDNFKQGDIDGIPIYPVLHVPRELHNRIVILGIHNPNVDIPNLKTELVQFGWQRSSIINLVEFYRTAESLNWNLPFFYWLGKSITGKEAVEIQSVRDLLFDEESRMWFDAHLSVRKNGVYPSVLSSPAPNQYCLPEIDHFSPFDFVDIGAYDGDTVAEMINYGYEFNSVYCFEPDSKNIQSLSNRINKMNLHCPITIFPVGAFNRFEICHFSEGMGEGACLSANGASSIQTAPLDEMLINQSVSYIKMDIEGAELEALYGSEKIIRKYTPVLAICVYHNPDHLWKIPLYIQSICSDYKFYLRTHKLNCFETVLYAIPDK